MNFEKAKTVCRGFPGAEEDIKWESSRIFSVGEKMFAGIAKDGPTSICFKVEDERFLELTDRPGITPAPYLARAKWVKVDATAGVSDAELAALLRRSYELVFAKLTRKLQREIEAAT